jgi:hypothetical protein
MASLEQFKQSVNKALCFFYPWWFVMPYIHFAEEQMATAAATAVYPILSRSRALGKV